MTKKGLVVSVGGSKGAYAGGILEYYIRHGASYDNFYGASIGALIIPFIAGNNYNSLKKVFSEITMDDIFTNNPFRIKSQNNGIFKYSINYWNVFKNIAIRKQSSLGDTTILKDETIPKFFTEDNYIKILNSGKVLKIAVTNISTGELEIKQMNDYTYEKYIDWMWASSCAPPFMSLPEIDNCNYTDGGVVSQVPIKQAIIDGCDEIDAIVLDKKEGNWLIEHIRNSFHYMIKTMLLMMERLRNYQIDPSYLAHHATKKIKINIHYTDRRLTNNALIFDNELMMKWWEEGYLYAENQIGIDRYIIDGKNNRFEKI
jgi:NTE family protein